MTIIAILDACVLYPAPLRDLLVSLSQSEFYQAKWTEEIHNEWINNLLAKRPDLKESNLTRTRQAMDRAILDCIVTSYDKHYKNIHKTDKKDQHILAAAIEAEANYIVTSNIKDFDKAELNKFAIKAIKPDDFILQLLSKDKKLFVSVLESIQQRLNNPPKTFDKYLKVLDKQGLSKTTKKIKSL